jgi:hypothetical protein
MEKLVAAVPQKQAHPITTTTKKHELLHIGTHLIYEKMH